MPNLYLIIIFHHSWVAILQIPIKSTRLSPYFSFYYVYLTVFAANVGIKSCRFY